MQTKKLTVLTEGGKRFGFGHITRCLSIIKYFEVHGFIVDFVIDGDNSVSLVLENQPFILNNWLVNTSIFQTLKDRSFVLIDSLRVSKKQISKIHGLDLDIILIDDDQRKNSLEKGFIIDWTILSEKKNHFIPKKKNVTYLLGSKYTPLRRPFIVDSKIRIHDEVKSILISFGGSDFRNLTPSIVKSINSNFPDLKKKVVIGDGFTNIESIKLQKDKNTEIYFNVNAIKMSSLMKNSDIAISSGGQTLYELISIGVPTIAILLVENARDDTEGWAEVGAIDYIGNFDDEDLTKKLLSSVKELHSKKRRQEMQSSSKGLIGFNGGKLIIEKVLNISNDII